MPKVGEYWNLVTSVKVDFGGNDFYYEDNTLVAKCVSVTERGPIFHGRSMVDYRKVYYGAGFYNCKWINKWEPNWFWKLLGYK